jgi:hypothetical protein
MSDLSLIAIKNGLFTDFRFNEVKSAIIKRLTELNMIHLKYKLDNEFLTLLTNMIEYLVVKKDKIDKKALALEIMKDFFAATDEDLEIISKNIEYLHNNRVIKKVSFWKLFKSGLCEWFKKKG